MTDIEKTKAEIKVLEKKLALLEEIEKQPRMNLQQEGEYAVVSYHDKVYYRLENKTTFSWYIKKGVSANYPVPTLVMVEDAETERLLEGIYYNHIQVKKEKGQQVKEVVRESVKWCEEHPDKDPLDWLKPQTREQVESGLKEAFREAVKQGVVAPHYKRKTLSDVIYDWWEDVFTTHSDWDMETSIENLVDEISLWLPTEHDTNSYKWNECIRMIRKKLR
jgi:hypothetical protein